MAKRKTDSTDNQESNVYVTDNTGVKGEEEKKEVAEVSQESPVYKKEANKIVKKKKASKFKFDESKYTEIEKYEEHIPIRQVNKRGQVVSVNTPTGRQLERTVLSEEFVKMYGGGSRDNKNALHKAECKIAAAKFFDVSIERLEDSYIKISGKKIDGLFVTDLIDRFGWSDGKKMSRDQLRVLYNKTNINCINIAQQKLCDILKSEDVTKAYVDLIKDIKEEFAEDLRNKVVYGE